MANKEAIKYLQQLYPNGGHCWLDEQRIEAIGMAVKALQEEPVSEDLREAARKYYKSLKDDCFISSDIMLAFKDGANWQKQQMMAKAINTEASFTMSVPSICISLPLGVNVGDKVKVIVIKED